MRQPTWDAKLWNYICRFITLSLFSFSLYAWLLSSGYFDTWQPAWQTILGSYCSNGHRLNSFFPCFRSRFPSKSGSWMEPNTKPYFSTKSCSVLFPPSPALNFFALSGLMIFLHESFSGRTMMFMHNLVKDGS